MSGSWLIFVDTNVFLDFYQLSGDSAERQMQALERHKDILITGDQVRMEFLKNRQKIIQRAISNIETPGFGNIPQILTGTQPAKAANSHTKSGKQKVKKLKERAMKILSDPARYDPVFKLFNKIYDHNSDFNLRRPKKVRFEVRELATKRHLLGYPPRKTDDTSIGDAVNWEWIVHCAINSRETPHILIVSRDGDFGVTVGKESYLNDWLAREFKDRVSRQRKIRLTTKLTEALHLLDESVQPSDVEEEERLVELRNARLSEQDGVSSIASDEVITEWVRAFKNYKRSQHFRKIFDLPDVGANDE